MPKYSSKIEIGFRQKWYQFWLPKTVTLYYNLDPINEVQGLAEDLRALVLDLTEEKAKVTLGKVRTARHIEIDTDDMSEDGTHDPIVEYFNQHDTGEALQPLQPLPTPKKIDILDADELEGDGGDFIPEDTGGSVVEYDPEAEAEWSPEQSGNVVIAQPDLIDAMKTKARKNDLRNMQSKYRNR